MFNNIDFDKPRYLYKYAPLNNYSLQAIANGHFWYSKLRTFNDPFEARSPIKQLKTSDLTDQLIQADTVKLDDVEIANLSNEYLFFDRFYHDFTSYVQTKQFGDAGGENNKINTILKVYEDVDDFGVLCLSSVPNDILMWSHYSDNHTGVCIQLEMGENSDLANMDKTFRVNYLDKYPDWEYFDAIDDLSRRNLIKSIVATKSKHWSYENEWRVIEEKGNQIYSSPARISGVIFGLRTSFSQKASIAKLLNNSSINVYEATRRINEYALEIVKLKSLALP